VLLGALLLGAVVVGGVLAAAEVVRVLRGALVLGGVVCGLMDAGRWWSVPWSAPCSGRRAWSRPAGAARTGTPG
jgi:hypothetical protein